MSAAEIEEKLVKLNDKRLRLIKKMKEGNAEEYAKKHEAELIKVNKEIEELIAIAKSNRY